MAVITCSHLEIDGGSSLKGSIVQSDYKAGLSENCNRGVKRRTGSWEDFSSFAARAALLLLIAIHYCIWICKVQDITTIVKFTFSNSLTKILVSSWRFNARRE